MRDDHAFEFFYNWSPDGWLISIVLYFCIGAVSWGIASMFYNPRATNDKSVWIGVVCFIVGASIVNAAIFFVTGLRYEGCSIAYVNLVTICTV